jgi:hypothetical protein
MAELKFPALEELGRQAGDWALNEFEYKGLTIRQWADKITTGEYQLVKHGHWIDNNNKTWSCSICQSWIPDEQHSYARYCLHCGAIMDEEDSLEKQEPTQEAETEDEE